MSALILNQFNPDYAVHPGEILEEILESRDISKTEFAKRCGVSLKKISEIINKKTSITPDTAIQFEKVLGISAETWNNLNAQYLLFLTQKKQEKQKESLIKWLKQFPIKILKERKILSDTTNKEQLSNELLKFFGVASVSAWVDVYAKPLAYYRSSKVFKQSFYTLTVWLRLIEIAGTNETNIKPYNKNKFLKVLKDIRCLIVKDKIDINIIKKMCKEAGVVFIIEKELPKIRLYGASRWISKHKVVLALTLRQKTNDQFWFSFFHEAGHILYHNRQRYFIDSDNLLEDRLEKEANSFANNFLIPEDDYKTFTRQGQFYKKDIIKFAERVNIHPGIVVGRLQHDGFISYKWHNDLKLKIE